MKKITIKIYGPVDVGKTIISKYLAKFLSANNFIVKRKTNNQEGEEVISNEKFEQCLADLKKDLEITFEEILTKKFIDNNEVIVYPAPIPLNMENSPLEDIIGDIRKI